MITPKDCEEWAKKFKDRNSRVSPWKLEELRLKEEKEAETKRRLRKTRRRSKTQAVKVKQLSYKEFETACIIIHDIEREPEWLL